MAGAILLLKDAGITSASVIKAILINTAQDKGDAEWDSLYGWGYIDLQKVHDQRYYFTDAVSQSAPTVTYKGVMGPGEKATVVWLKHWTYNETIPYYPTNEVSPLSNLALYLRRNSNNALLDSCNTSIDNVEQVQYTLASAETVKVEVTLKQLGSGLQAESFALAVPRSGYQKVTGGGKPIAGMTRPPRFSLSENHPNPFNPETTIQFTLPDEHQARLTIYNISGQRIATLLDEQMPKGRHSVVWSGKDATGKDVASGVYFYQLTAGDFTATRKMLLIR